MNEIFKTSDFIIARPLLYINPQIMKNYLQERNISWVEDESNYCPDLLRVKIRQFLPELEQKTGISALQIVQTMQRLQTSKKHIDNEVEKIMKHKFNSFENKAFWCSVSEFLILDTELQYRIFGKILKIVGNSDYTPQADKVFNLIKKIQTDDFKSATLNKCQIKCFNNKIWIFPEKIVCPTYSAKAWKDFAQNNKHYNKKKLPSELKKLILLHCEKIV